MAQQRDVVVIGGSAGAFQPLTKIVADLDPDLPAALVAVIHTSSDGERGAWLLQRAGKSRHWWRAMTKRWSLAISISPLPIGI